MDRPDVGSRIRIRIRIGTATGQGQGRRKACKAVGAAYLLRGTTLEKEEEEAGADSTSMAAALEVAAAAVVVVTIQQADRRPDQVSSAWNSAVSLSLFLFPSPPRSLSRPLRVLCSFVVGMLLQKAMRGLLPPFARPSPTNKKRWEDSACA